MADIAGVFEVGTTGEQFIVAEWHPSLKVVEAQLLQFAVATENMLEPLTEAKEAFIYDTSLHFETESDPYGRAWTALEEGYEKRKQALGYEGNILHKSGSLEAAATSQANWIVTERDILFNTAGLPFYGPYHQAGSSRYTPEQWDLIHKIRTGGVIEPGEGVGVETSTVGLGRGKALPQRMFIGADEDTIAEVEAIFLKWLDKVIREDFPPMETAPEFGLGSNIRGTAQIIGFLPSGQPRLKSGQFGRKV